MCLFPVKLPNPKGTDFEPLQVGCGKCIECLQQRSNEWAHRIVDECKQHSDNCFITLTYNPENLPSDGSVSRREVQLFMKRLRKFVYPVLVRYFACGEYGKKGGRPHYHLIIFGWKPSDLFFWQRDKSGVDLYRSPSVEKLWTKGFSSVGNVTLDTAKYCAKYLQKLNKVSKSLTPAFTQMSLRPGIGFDAINAKSLTSDRIYHNGSYVHIPRYYLKVLERDGHDLEEFKARRVLIGKLKAVSPDDLKRKREKFFKFVGKKH